MSTKFKNIVTTYRAVLACDSGAVLIEGRSRSAKMGHFVVGHFDLALDHQKYKCMYIKRMMLPILYYLAFYAHFKVDLAVHGFLFIYNTLSSFLCFV